jgi:3-oxoacyl-ACP reductase-like protein
MPPQLNNLYVRHAQSGKAATKVEKNMGTTNYVPALLGYTKKKAKSAVRRGGPAWPPAIVIPAEPLLEP